MTDEIFEVFAIKYGHVNRPASENFIGGDPHNGPMPLDFFVWAAIGPEHTYVIDLGYSEIAAKRRGRELIRTPAAGLDLVNVDAATVQDVVVTHLHYDHVGNFDMFPQATFHLQDREMAYATGRHMKHKTFSGAYEVDEVVGMVREVYAGRVAFHDGDEILSPGFSVHFIGGHTMGLQSVRVKTKRGWVVLASDASHFYANMQRPQPFPIVYNVAEMLEGFDKLRRLADSEDHIIPGHDPLVLDWYPAPSDDLNGIVARLDVAPQKD